MLPISAAGMESNFCDSVGLLWMPCLVIQGRERFSSDHFMPFLHCSYATDIFYVLLYGRSEINYTYPFNLVLNSMALLKIIDIVPNQQQGL